MAGANMLVSGIHLNHYKGCFAHPETLQNEDSFWSIQLASQNEPRAKNTILIIVGDQVVIRWSSFWEIKMLFLWGNCPLVGPCFSAKRRTWFRRSRSRAAIHRLFFWYFELPWINFTMLENTYQYIDIMYIYEYIKIYIYIYDWIFIHLLNYSTCFSPPITHLKVSLF